MLRLLPLDLRRATDDLRLPEVPNFSRVLGDRTSRVRRDRHRLDSTDCPAGPDSPVRRFVEKKTRFYQDNDQADF